MKLYRIGIKTNRQLICLCQLSFSVLKTGFPSICIPCTLYFQNNLKLRHPRRRFHSMLYESFAQNTTRSTRALNKRRRRTIHTPRQRRAMPVLDIFSMNDPWNPPLPIVRRLPN
ncbi:hypothetical protein CEXT_220371 [Caerostris extrusa]|uniref:Uncharacterized protein n=1 Tax=Caerostris extrusa TaxID=172846 RepID=A0AAV4TWD0_CAEEX|nr:hypothetical protein CEXT_220371 [Caerostris extrusa]